MHESRRTQLKYILHRPLNGPVLILLLLLSLLLTACNETAEATPTVATGIPPVSGTTVITASGLKYIDVKVGSGSEAKEGQTLTVQYTGYLTTGQKFDSSYDHGRPFSFRLGDGHVIKGWEEGLVGMKVNGKRRLLVPSSLGYGSKSKGSIPANADLIFDVELLKAK